MAAELTGIFAAHLVGHRELFARLDALAPAVEAAGAKLAAALAAGGSVWLAGNGGSAADAQHIAAEMEGRLEQERPARAVHRLVANASTLSSVGNAYGLDPVFPRQVAGFARRGDLLVLISTSGKSPNLLRAAEAARERGVGVIGLLGKGGGPLAALCELAIVVPSEDTQWIQEAHALIGHALCKLIDRALPPGPLPTGA